MKKGIINSCIIAISFLFICHVCVAKLTNQQINLLLENDDIQIFTPSFAIVKKASVTVEQSTDNSQGKTIAEYDKKGLLINYYAASVIGETAQEQSTIITTLMRTGNEKWQRKQTMGSYEISNSIYTLKGDNIQITLLPSYSLSEQRLIFQNSQPIDEDQKLRVFFSYAKPPENEKLVIEYIFKQDGLLNLFNSEDIDENEYGYISTIRVKFEYDEQQRLSKGSEFSHYQFMNEPAEEIITNITYSNFDEYGNWLTKIEQFGRDHIVYKRIIEYWNQEE